MVATTGLSRSYSSGSHARRAATGRAALKYWTDRGRDLVATAFDRPKATWPRLPRVHALFYKRKPLVTSIASERKIIWVRPEDIVFKISGDHDLRANDIVAGDWDLKRAIFVETIKYRSIIQHFQEGVRWEDTELFAWYADRFRREEVVRGAESLSRLKRQYETKVDALFRDLRTNGFRIARDLLGQPTNVPHVHIARGGEILYGTKGNHRLAMAKLLSIGVIPCHVRARHAEWQKIRDVILSDVALTQGARELSNTYREFRGHPDLADLLYPNQ